MITGVQQNVSGCSLQTGPVSLGNGPLDHSVPPLPRVKWFQAQEGQQHPQVFHTILDRGA